jgi:hypothetical protein
LDRSIDLGAGKWFQAVFPNPTPTVYRHST